MPMRIMVPLDGSEFSEQALSYAFGIARRSEAELHLVRVHSAPRMAYLAAGFIAAPMVAEGSLREAELAYLDSLAEYAAMHVEHTPRTSLLSGPVAPALEWYVRSNGIDLVIMTTHGRTGLSRAWIGSVADALVRTIEPPVLLLRPRTHVPQAVRDPVTIDHILIPIDENLDSADIVQPALDLGRFTSARYTLLQIISPPFAVPTADAGALPLQFARAVELRMEAAAHIEELARQLRTRGCDVETAIVMHGQIAHGILEQAVGLKADVIAMPTHGRHGFARFALGSVTDKVVRATSVPLLLWKPRRAGSDVVEEIVSGRNDENGDLGLAHDRAAYTAYAAADTVRPPV